MLEVENLYAAYGSVPVLKGVSLSVDEGEIVALIGANGAGKSTTLMAISGFVRVVDGGIKFRGKRIDRLRPHTIVGMGVCQVPEGRHIFPGLTVAENLRMGAFSRTDRQGIADDMHSMGTLFPVLRQRWQQLAGTLSGGEQQMLAIGRALMAGPKLLLLDEPSLGLAPLLVEKIFEVIREINRRGTAVLLVEQNAHAALEVAARAYVLETGSVVLEGPAQTLLQNEMVKKAYLGE